MAVVTGKTKSGKPNPKKPDMAKLKAEQDKQAKKDAAVAAKKKKQDEKDAAKKAKKEAAAKAKAEKAAAKKAKIVKAKADILPPIPEAERKAIAEHDDAEFRKLEKESRTNFVHMGIILRRFDHYNLWKDVVSPKTGKGFTSFGKWLRDAAPVSYSGGYAALKVAEKLLPLMPKEEMEQIPRRNLDLLAKVPKLHLEKVDSPIRKAARSGSEKDLRSAIQKHAPEAHVDQQSTIKLDEGAKAVTSEAIEAMMVIGECATPGEALEAICEDWMLTACNCADYPGLNNRQLAEALRAIQPNPKEGEEQDEPVAEQPEPEVIPPAAEEQAV